MGATLNNATQSLGCHVRTAFLQGCTPPGSFHCHPPSSSARSRCDPCGLGSKKLRIAGNLGESGRRRRCYSYTSDAAPFRRSNHSCIRRLRGVDFRGIGLQRLRSALGTVLVLGPHITQSDCDWPNLSSITLLSLSLSSAWSKCGPRTRQRKQSPVGCLDLAKAALCFFIEASASSQLCTNGH